MSEPVVIVPTGLANLASVQAGLERAGAPSVIAGDAAQVSAATRVMLPGVGAFGPAMTTLEEGGFADALRERVGDGRPTMAICLGLQLLFEQSEESAGTPGLGLLPGRVSRFGSDRVVPHMGWNLVSTTPGAALLREGYAYFANSFYAREVPDGWEGAHCEYGVRFAAAIERGALLACQFHPELSGRYGLELLRRWLDVSDKGRP